MPTFDRLAALAEGRTRRVLAAAGACFALAGAFGGSVADRLDPYGAEDPATESVQAREALERAGYRQAGVIVLLDRVGQAEKVAAELRERDDVAKVTGYAETKDRDFLSKDGAKTFLAVGLAPLGDKAAQEAAEAIAHDFGGRDGISVGGGRLAEAHVNRQVESDLRRAEMLAFPLLFLLSLLFFRSLVAALLPLLVGALAIVGTFAGLRAASEAGSISIFALNLTTGLGLGLAIDYSLFIVSRYREEIAKDGPGLPAMRRTLNTAGRTVLFSSLTVAAALASLIVFPQRFLYSMGIGGAIVAVLAAAVALLVLPAVLAALGHRVNALSPQFLHRRAERDARSEQSGFWYRLSQLVMRRPAPIAAISAAALLVAGIPFLSVGFTWPNAQILPDSSSAHQVDDVMRAQFAPFRDQPIQIAVRGGGEAAARALVADAKATAGVVKVRPPVKLDGDMTLVEAISGSEDIANASRDTVKRLRDLPPPAGAEVLVTGRTAEFVDFQGSLVDHLPLAVGIVVLSTLLILFGMTGSVVLPVKALLMNVLNLSAVFGLLVLIFQDGRLEGLLDYESQGALEQTMPLLIFAVCFGLSTDYAVFLLSRIKEARDGGAGNAQSVAIGLERTGRIVTAAALLFAIAIGAFATSEIVFIKQNGIGTALAVLIDASIIRALLVPALMELLGEWNWWAPAPLRRLHERLGLREAT